MSGSAPPQRPWAEMLDLHSPQRRLIELEIEHADLNALVDEAAASSFPSDDLSMRRLKKRRLALRDQMAMLSCHLQPKEPA